MDRISRAWYEREYSITLLRKTGDAFQDFFHDIMGRRYPGDFVPTRPWGRIGDRKNDGFLRSARVLFQIYAPDDLALAETLKKINEDFHGALPHWQKYFGTWRFVHNARDGKLAARVLALLLKLEEDNTPLKVDNWGIHEIRKTFFELQDADIVAILGPAVSELAIASVRMEGLTPLLKRVGGLPPVVDGEILPVPPEKLQANALSDNVQMLLRAGMLKAPLVEKFFANHHDATYGDRIAKHFNREYQRLRAEDAAPDDIFWGLQNLISGGLQMRPDDQAASLALLAHLFESCDIFERPISAVSS